MGCKVQRGITNVCGDLLFPGGVDKDIYVGYVSDLSNPISITQAADISTISFAAYNGLVRFEGQKFAHKIDVEWVKGTGGNGFYKQTATVKFISLSTQDDVEVQRLTQALDAFIVYQDNNLVYKILGAGKGLMGSAGPLQSTGQQASDDVSDTIILEGAEKTKPLIFNVGSQSLTLNFLTTHLI